MTYQQVLGQHPSYAEWCKTEMDPGSSWKLVRCVSCLNEQETVQPRQEMTRDPKEVLTEPPEARGGARSSRRRTMDVMMEDELEELEKLEAAAQEEKNANQLIQQQVLATLTQLNQRLEKLEEQQSTTSSAAGSFLPVGSSQSGREEA